MKQENQVPEESPMAAKPAKTAKVEEVPASPMAPAGVAMSMEDLKAFITQSAAVQAEVIANALIESRKPYVSEQQIANQKMMREQMKRQAKIAKEAEKRAQAACQHIQGCDPLSDSASPTGATSIVHHKLDTQLIIGLCTVCGRVFWPEDPDYMQWMGKKSGNRPSGSGYRWFPDPIAAMQAR